MKAVRYLAQAQRALLKHRNRAERIMDKIMAYADDPASQANNVKRLKGRDGVLRLRVGDFRVLFAESETEILVLDIGPRGDVYD
ncbi:MAG: type II toxin-antitoxin system RelE/ParE family toxin [Bauldia sp.]|nr:type II toxin-antitoxin system RelE/ParE family toxin [Bauldia sp.]